MPKAVIMAGGVGERFWPITHSTFPKYRLKFHDKKSLLVKTFDRLAKVYGKENVYVITTEFHARLIKKELPFLKKDRILIEPSRKNTANAIYLSTALLEQRFGEEEVVSFFPADHLIKNEVLFKKTIQNAIKLAAKKDYLVTVGITPTFPATGYGYIENGSRIQGFADAYQVKRFVEKPNLQKALSYIQKKNFYWNGGIFTWRIGTFMKAMRKFSPQIPKLCDLKRLKQSYAKLPSVSIDVALFEKADCVAICKTQMDWCDVGSWDMFFEKSPGDPKGCYAEGLVVQEESKSSLFLNQTSVPLISLGVSDLLVIQTPRGTLVCPRGRSEQAALLFRKI